MFLSVENVAAANYATVVTTSDLKNHLRVTSNDEESLINSYRSAACQFVENYCNTRLTSQSVYFYAQAFGSIGEFQIGPVISVSAVEYKTSKTGSYITLDSANYYVEKARVPALIKFMTAPSTDGDALAPVRVTATCGYATTPEPLVHAVRLLVAHYFENRQAAEVGSIKEIPLGIKSLLNTYRSISFR